MRIPQATYRIQFHAGFNFDRTQAIIEYLSALGISDIYASPIFTATPGSTHGYDVTDPTCINPELGTPEQFAELIAKSQQHRLGWLQDIVPNHMAYSVENLWLMDVLENGQKSSFAQFFDINWQHHEFGLQGRVLAPLLGDRYGNCLINGEIKLHWDAGGLSAVYYDTKLPVNVESYLTFLTHHLENGAGGEVEALSPIIDKIKYVSSNLQGGERRQQVNEIKARLHEAKTQNQAIAAFIDRNLTAFNGTAGKPETFNLLDKFLSQQFYRLSYWKVATEEINYRRFFTVNELISVRVEEEEVFQQTHELISQMVAEGKITGVRVDHIDGLYDPLQYINRLREKLGDIFISVEKILELKEDLPPSWQIAGTSGYEFLNYLNGIFCQTDSEAAFSQIYQDFSNNCEDYESMVYAKKSLILAGNLAGDLDNLAKSMRKIAAETKTGRDFTFNGLEKALFALLSLLPVYRTYVDGSEISEVDREYVEEAIALATAKLPLLENEVEFIGKVLLLDYPPDLTESQQQQWLHFVKRSQQLTGPLTAKGVEDTLLYVYNRLLSLNEVGGNPRIFGISLDLFHEFNQKKVKQFPHGMNATATHDTKRGEDVRARLNVLSEIPETWQKRVKEWQEVNRDAKEDGIPESNDEYFLYQTILGAYPFSDAELPEFKTRIKDYILKSIREAKVNTDWLLTNEAYEKGFFSFIDRVLDPENSSFWDSFLPFQKQIAEYGIYNSLSQILIKHIAPGIPDLYQGAELWELSLVDPDNRRPVDYQKRMDFLTDIQAKIPGDRRNFLKYLIATQESGKIKLFLIHQLLKARQQHPELFNNGDYQPIEVAGKYRNNAIAWARNYNGRSIVAIAPRFLTQVVSPGQLPVGEVWNDTYLQLPPGNWYNPLEDTTISGEKLALRDILVDFPVGFLIKSKRTYSN